MTWAVARKLVRQCQVEGDLGVGAGGHLEVEGDVGAALAQVLDAGGVGGLLEDSEDGGGVGEFSGGLGRGNRRSLRCAAG